MKTVVFSPRAVIAAALLGFMVFVIPAFLAAEESTSQIITGSIVNMMGGGPQTPLTERFTLTLNGYTPMEELDALAALQKAKGDEALQTALWEVKDKGSIQIGTTLGYPLAVVYLIPHGDQRVIRIITDRPIQYYEALHSIRTLHYPFSFFEITLDRNGHGEGKFIPVAQVTFKPGGDLEVKDYAAMPFKLLQVKVAEK